MDILIKNMEMPKDGTLRLIIFPNGRVDEINSYNEACMSTDAKATEVPAHGDLIDRNTLKSKTHTASHLDGWKGVVLESDIDSAPVIMEAST